ncbi:phosphotyrosine interaction domain protein [Dictyocaulus viviparus]|uniref:Phosphotyrosine interaction domain protein n=1 Tax=Dictyocaulus viviparus TaxID=29172 RepID=A0A0D8XY34_DICVI|nr:phosphotyrosine interaction domain protein [Dictyocaulus viviparus]
MIICLLELAPALYIRHVTSKCNENRDKSSVHRSEVYEDDEDDIEEEYIEEEKHTFSERIVTKRHNYGGDNYNSVRREHDRRRQKTNSSDMAVDYSSQDFRQSLASMDAASRDGFSSREGNSGVRIRQHGDTTVMTEHRDPYSFYWQLDQNRRRSESPKRYRPPTDYVIDEEEVIETILSPESHDSGVAFENQYSKPIRVNPPATSSPQPVEDDVKQLPPGWEKHQDPSGFSYYWHVDSGTIQREPPSRETQSDAQPSPQIIQLPPYQPVIEEHAFKQTTTKRRIENNRESEGEEESGYRKPIRFAVRSLGWTEIAEEDLTAERSSRAVNRAIVDLSTGRNDLIDNVSKWGDGRELIMELDDNELSLIDPDTLTVIHSEKIQQIRVWGVGRDNGRDFAYVSRDRNSRRFLCHVFRCDTPAKTIANTLRDICKRLMLYRRPSTINTTDGVTERRVIKTNGLTTPTEEPKKVIRCHFLGVTQVPRATGIQILNEAVDRLVSQVRAERWILSDVSIAPSTITISEVGGGQIAQCRVRYLSFLGIGRDIKHCAFIMHTSPENFMCYVFHVEPSAAAMAKTIEAACKLRYQKVLDAHAGRVSQNVGQSDSPSFGKGWTESLRDVFGSVTQRIVPSRSLQSI